LLERLAQAQQGPGRCIQPVGIVGPGNGGRAERAAAYEIANVLAHSGMSIICGGRGGVMESASQGAYDAGGIVVGILPEEDVSAANPYLTVGIPTGMGEMRNALIARSSVCLVAIGGGMGTLSEVALGLKWGKPVFAIHEEIKLPGTTSLGSIGELIEGVASCLLRDRS